MKHSTEGATPPDYALRGAMSTGRQAAAFHGELPTHSAAVRAAAPVFLLACVAALIFHGASRSQAALFVPLLWPWMAWVARLSKGQSGPTATQATAIALLVRAPFLLSPPHLSDDGFRYVWEGLASNHGFNPFLVAPSDLPGLDDALRARVNHPELTSIYPPLACWWFRAIAFLSPTLPTLRLATALIDSATAGALARRARRGWGWAWALHPLAVLESAAGAHLETLGVGAACLAVIHPRVAPLWLACGAWFKVFPALFWYTAMRELPWGRRVAWTAAALAGTVVLAMPWLDAGPHLWASAGAYAAHWSFNGFLWPIVHGLAPAAARPILWALGAVGTAYAWWRARTLADVWWQIALIFLATTPTAHPWYGLWLLAPAVLLERRWAMWATTFGMHGYLVLSTVDASGAWTETPWLWASTWLPIAVVALARGRHMPLPDHATKEQPTTHRTENGTADH
jgi:hypothetical protein